MGVPVPCAPREPDGVAASALPPARSIEVVDASGDMDPKALTRSQRDERGPEADVTRRRETPSTGGVRAPPVAGGVPACSASVSDEVLVQAVANAADSARFASTGGLVVVVVVVGGGGAFVVVVVGAGTLDGVEPEVGVTGFVVVVTVGGGAEPQLSVFPGKTFVPSVSQTLLHQLPAELFQSKTGSAPPHLPFGPRSKMFPVNVRRPPFGYGLPGS